MCRRECQQDCSQSHSFRGHTSYEPSFVKQMTDDIWWLSCDKYRKLPTLPTHEERIISSSTYCTLYFVQVVDAVIMIIIVYIPSLLSGIIIVAARTHNISSENTSCHTDLVRFDSIHSVQWTGPHTTGEHMPPTKRGRPQPHMSVPFSQMVGGTFDWETTTTTTITTTTTTKSVDRSISVRHPKKAFPNNNNKVPGSTTTTHRMLWYFCCRLSLPAWIVWQDTRCYGTEESFFPSYFGGERWYDAMSCHVMYP